MLDKVQKQVYTYRSVGLSLIVSVEPLTHCQNVASINLFYKYSFGRRSSKLANLVLFILLEGCVLIILMGCMIFLSLFLMFMLTVSLYAELDSGILDLPSKWL